MSLGLTQQWAANVRWRTAREVGQAMPSEASIASVGSSPGMAVKGSLSGRGNSVNSQSDSGSGQQVLHLPDTAAVRQHVETGKSTITFLAVALGIIGRLEEHLKGSSFEDELRFVRDCLQAGPAKTQLPCKLLDWVDDQQGVKRNLCEYVVPGARVSLTSRGPLLMSVATSYESEGESVAEDAEALVTKALSAAVLPLRKDYELRGALRATRAAGNATLPPRAMDAAEKGMPWMGPVVPTWPSSGLSMHDTSALQSLFQDHFSSWNFDIFSVPRLTDGHPLLFVGWEAFVRSGCFSEFNINSERVAAFLSRAEKLYASERSTPYHNNIHAADVTQTVHSLMVHVGLSSYLDPMDCLVSVLSAVVHDMGHDGRNNAFHMGVQDELALTYNDRSILENYALAEAFKMFVPEAPTNMLYGLCREQRVILRKEVIEMVLATDMSNHFSCVGVFAEFQQKRGANPDAWQADDAAMYALRSMLLHSADISNPAKPFNIARNWSVRCLKEFFAQGDIEKEQGVPVSPLCDRWTTDVPGSQMGFIKFIVQPSFEALASLSPKVEVICLREIIGNHKAWESRRQDPGFYGDDILRLRRTSTVWDERVEEEETISRL